MSPQPIEERIQEQAALYVLGLLRPEEIHEFDARLSAADPSYVEALRQAREPAARLANSLDPVDPPVGLKERLMQRINAPKMPGLGAVRSDEGKWKRSAPGVYYKKLYFDPSTGLVTILVRMAPGATYASHNHSRTEQCLILEGDLWCDQQCYVAGDFTIAEAGSTDPDLYTKTGNLLLIMTAPGDEPATRSH